MQYIKQMYRSAHHQGVRTVQYTHTRARAYAHIVGCIAQRNLLQSICDTNIFYVYVKKTEFVCLRFFLFRDQKNDNNEDWTQRDNNRCEEEKKGEVMQKLKNCRPKEIRICSGRCGRRRRWRRRWWRSKTRTEKDYSFCRIRFLLCMPYSNEDDRKPRKTEMAQIMKYHYKSSFATAFACCPYSK